MIVTVSLPDGYTGVMCDSAGHDGFGPFDNALVLWRGGNPGASCADEKKTTDEETQEEKNKMSSLRRTILGGKNNKFQKNSFQLKWHAAVLYFVSWWLLAENISVMTPKLHRRVLLYLKELSVAFITIRHNLVSQPLLNTYASQWNTTTVKFLFFCHIGMIFEGLLGHLHKA